MPQRLWDRRSRFAIDADCAWVLRRAFADPAAVAFPPADPRRAAHLAAALALAPRVFARAGWESLVSDLGREAARPLALEHAAAEARGLQIAELAHDLAANGRPVAFLKLAALFLIAAVAPGGRHGSDLDVLVPESDLAWWSAQLRGAGFAASAVPGYEHHPPAFVHPRRGMVELHVSLPGVRVRGARFARFEDLRDAGLLRRLATGVLVPNLELLGAHAIAHGWAQHGAAPHSYPALQWLADLRDLGLGRLGRIERGWIARDVPDAVVSAAFELLDALRSGSPPATGPGRDLLDHLLAGTLDAEYREALAVRRWRPLSERRALPARLALWRRALFPSAAELRALYGARAGRFGVLRQRLWRPLDVAARAWHRTRVLRRQARRT